MWTDLAPAWQACLEEAWAAYVAGSVPIGAVVCDADGLIVARGRNRIADPLPSADPGPRRPVAQHDLAHAELNALLALPLSGWDKSLPNSPRQWALYTTIEPCPLCLGAFYMSGLRQLHYAARDPYAGSVNLLGATPYLRVKPIRAAGPHPDLEPLCTAVCVEQLLRTNRAGRKDDLLDLWRQAVPAGAALGERLHADHVLVSLQAARAPAAEMLAYVTAVQRQLATGPTT
ncbi:MAG: nucleoside deaminase [Anaerolineales bacterium]|nr:nucleoside deaminase [Anaerolineales bacterium]